MVLRGYAVLKTTTPDDPAPFCIVRIDVDMDMGGQATHWIVAEHPSRNIALYWATMLNDGKESEDSVREKIAAANARERRG